MQMFLVYSAVVSTSDNAGGRQPMVFAPAHTKGGALAKPRTREIHQAGKNGRGSARG